MKYQPPFEYPVPGSLPDGIHNSDADAVYVNADPSTGSEGSIPPAESIEHAQREIVNVIMQAGLTPDHTDLTQLYQAITNIHSSSNVSMSHESNPVFPEVVSVGNVLSVNNNGGGQIEVATGQTFVHRGMQIYETDDYAQNDRRFNTVANKSYHLRWNPDDGFGLKDLSDPTYNPGSLLETATGFDTGYDDMLVARVVTDGGNIPTITTLVNRNILKDKIDLSGAPTVSYGQNQAYWNKSFVINFSRRPIYLPTRTYTSWEVGNSEHDKYFSFDGTETRYGASLGALDDGCSLIAASVLVLA